MWEELKKYRAYLILGPSAKLLETIFELIIPRITADIIDYSLPAGDRADITSNIFLMVLLTILGFVATATCQYFSAKCAYGYGNDLRNSLFRRTLKLEFTDIDKFGTSTLITRLTNDTDALSGGINYVLRLVTRTPFLIIGSIISVLAIFAKLSIIFVISAIFIAIIMFFITNWAMKMFRFARSQLDKITTSVRENITGTRVIRAFSKGEYEEKKFNSQANDFAEINIKTVKYDSLITPISFLILNLSTIFVVHFGSVEVNFGNITQGEFAAIINYLSLILLAIMQFVMFMPNIANSLAAYKRLKELNDLENNENFSQKNISNSENVIMFQNVTKYYNDSPEPAVKNVNFEIKKGDCVGIIGGTGVGKSTLVQLLLGFYPITSGDILLFGEKISTYSKEELRNLIGYIPQKDTIFTGTVRENIQIAKKNATDLEIFNALKLAQADFITDLSQKITQNNLSGGQKQRLCIARILVRNPEILILDNSTSSLDYATENALMTALKAEYSKKILIVISQREQSVRFCTKILKL